MPVELVPRRGAYLAEGGVHDGQLCAETLDVFLESGLQHMELESYTLKEREHYEDVLRGPFLMELVHMTKLPIREIKVTKRKSGFWGVKTKKNGRKEDPKTKDTNYGTLTHDYDMDMNTVVHDAIAHLSYRHRVELGTHYFGRLGWQKPEGAHIILKDE
ncbi:hypothetical protein D1007_58165 [Hordeum vulgare]|nr:hypothetical protein D1007_58165 [Hordeum vulgare]